MSQRRGHSTGGSSASLSTTGSSSTAGSSAGSSAVGGSRELAKRIVLAVTRGLCNRRLVRPPFPRRHESPNRSVSSASVVASGNSPNGSAPTESDAADSAPTAADAAAVWRNLSAGVDELSGVGEGGSPNGSSASKVGSGSWGRQFAKRSGFSRMLGLESAMALSLTPPRRYCRTDRPQG